MSATLHNAAKKTITLKPIAVPLARTRLEAMPVRRLLRPVPADRHAAPSSRAAAGVIREKQRAGRTFASLHV